MKKKLLKWNFSKNILTKLDFYVFFPVRYLTICKNVSASAAFQRAAEPAVHPWPGIQGAGAAHGPPLRLCPHLLQVTSILVI